MIKPYKGIGNQLVLVLCIWILISSIYYVEYSFSGSVWADRNADFLHKACKYVIAFIIPVFSIFNSLKKVHFLLFPLIIIIICSLIILLRDIFKLGDAQVADILVIISAFSGFTILFRLISNNELRAVLRVIILSGVMVSLFAFYELFFLDKLLGNYWLVTGGYRAVSTLLNPNNLGIYMGAVILFLIFSDFQNPSKIFLFFLFLTVLLMSGSRTAIISLLFCFFFTTYFLAKKKLIILYVYLLSSALMLVFYIFLYSLDVLPERAQNMHTAFIRLERYVEYLMGFNLSYFYPDFSGIRSELVTESTYFYLVNSVGIIGSGFILLLWFLFFKFEMKNDSIYIRPFLIVCIYYIFTCFFGNTLMSFPNNQLLFLSMGSIFTLRKICAGDNTRL